MRTFDYSKLNCTIDNEIMGFILEHIPSVSYIEADKKFYRTLTEKEEKDLGIIEDVKFNLQ